MEDALNELLYELEDFLQDSMEASENFWRFLWMDLYINPSIECLEESFKKQKGVSGRFKVFEEVSEGFIGGFTCS